MYNIRLAGLDTGREYYVKVRAKVLGYETSEWTHPFKFSTPRDTMPPGPVGFLRFVSEGDSFLTNWAAPTVNADGSPCADVAYYNVKLENLDTGTVARDRSVDPSYPIDLNKNASLFGTLAGKIEITITAVDLSGNEGIGVSAIAQNPPPSKVVNVTASVGVESVGLKWDENTESDLANYEIHVGSASGFTPSQSTLRAKVAAGTNTHTYDTASLTTLYFKIIAVDKFSQKSIPSDVVSAQPRLTTDYDKTPPGVVAGVTVTQSLAPDNANAVAKISYTGLTDADLDKYEVQYRKTGETIAPWSFTSIPSDQTSAEIKPLPLSTSYDFRIRAVDFNSNKGAWSSVVVAPGVKKTTLPAAPTGVTVRGGTTNLMVTWNQSTDPSMSSWAGTYEVQISKATTFTSPITIKTSSTLASFISLDANTIYYVRIRSIDPYGNIGAWSTRAQGNTGQALDPLASRIYWADAAPTGGRTNDVWIKIPENVQYRFDGTDWIKAQDTELADEIDNVRQTADGKNKAWYQTTKPPATNNTQGDLWFDTDDGNKLHVWSTSANDWVSAQDAAIQDALDNADEALQTADGKNTIFYTAPASGVTPREGDTWFDNAVIKVYKNGAWVNASDDLDTAKARQAIQIAGSKNKTYYVAKASATGMIEGDILFDTAEGNKQYRYDGSTWVAVTDAAIAAAEEAAGQAQETANKKNTIYYSTPPTTGLRDGDTWFDGPTIKTYRNGVWTDSSSNLETQQGADAIQVAGSKNKTYYTTFANRPTTGLTEGDLLFDTGNKYKQYRYTNAGWLSVQDGTIADAKTAADNAKAAAELRAQTFYEATEPANTNSRLKTNDLWIRSTDNQLHRWTGSAWAEIQDDAIALTQSNLSTAVGELQTSIGNVQAIADGKINTFISNTAPTQGLDNGDIWFDTSVTPVSTKVYDGTDWIVSGDKAAIDAAAAVQVNLNATNTALNKKNTTYAQTSAPTTGLVAGDLWLNTTLVSGVAKNEMNRWDGAKWVKTQDKLIFDVSAIADGKAMVFTKATMPTNAESDLGDIWFDTRDTPWSVKVRTGAATWTVSGDKDARDAAQTAQNEASRKIQSFYTDTDPATVTANNVKAGDLWYKTNDKRARVRATNNTWVELKDVDIKKAQDAADAAQASANTAITNAGNAFDLADGKAQVFWGGTRPTNLVVADAGDIWVDTEKTPNEIQVWSGTAWTVTGDPATKAIAEAANTLAGQKSYTYIENSAPTAASTPAPTKGDIWIKNNVTPNEVSVYTGSAWVASGDKAARDAAATKAYIFTTTNDTAPTSPAPKRGDIWINTTSGLTKVRTATAWVLSTDPEARSIANSKITTYYNATAPTAPTGGFTTGDLWVRTTDNRLHRWAGSWVELKDKSITDLESLTEDIIDDLIPGLETQLDNKIEVYVQNDAPAITNAAKQKGDIWIRPANGEVKVYSGTAWVVSADPAAKALANTAQTTADKKMQTFYGSTGPANSPVGTLKVNDLWIDSDNKRLHRWNGSKWEEVKDADITAAQQAANAAAGQAATAIANAGTAFDLADKKAQIFYGGTRPTGLKAADKGDIWVNQAETPNEIQTWTGTTWVTAGDPATKTIAEAAQTLAGQKSYVYTQTTTPTSNPAPTRGDTWIHTTTGETKIYSGSAWIAMTDPEAQAIANRKITTYYGSNTPSVPTGGFTTGDLWVKTPENRMSRWSGTVWAEIKDSAITAVEGTVNNLSNTIIPGLVGQIDSKVEVYIQDTQPATPVADRAKMKGDLWINPSTGLVKIYSGTNNVWNDVKDPAAAQAAIDAAALAGKKVQVFGGETVPTNNTTNALQVNDLWIRDSDKKMHRWTGTVWEIAQDRAIGSLESKGTDLIVNGTGIMGDNTNFPGWTYFQNDLPEGAVGAFRRRGAATLTLGQLIPWDSSKKYKISLDIKSLGETESKNYLGIMPRDAFGKNISQGMYMFRGGTTTKLAADLKPGDDKIYLEDSSNWAGRQGEAQASLTNRSVIIWDYVDPGGKVWPKETLSDNYLVRGSYESGAIDPVSHVITLNSPYAGRFVPKDTYISNSNYGGRYVYMRTLSNFIAPAEWTRRADILPGLIELSADGSRPGASFLNGFPPGTSALSIVFLSNYQGEDTGEVGIANLSVSDASAAYDHATTAMESANARNRSIYSTGNPSGSSLNGYSFIDGDTWYRRDSNDTIIGMWERKDNSWVAKTLNNQVIANLDAGKINAGTISADRIGAKSIETSKIVVGGLDASVVIEDGTITATQIAGETITASEIAAGAITAHKIKANEIDASKIVSGGMDGSVVIEEGTITATEIAGQTITGDEIKGNTIDAGHIKAGSITIGAPGSPLNPAGIATPSTVATAKSEAISTASGDATTKANKARTDAISAAATDAQTKADNAKTAAEQAAKDYADGQITQAEADAIAAAAITAQEKADTAKQAAIDAAAIDAKAKADKALSDAKTDATGKVNAAVGPINTTLGKWTKTGTTFIDGGEIFTDSITAGQIAAGAITVSELGANSVTAAKIKSDEIETRHIKTGQITADKIVSTGLDGSTVITNGTITTEKINAKAITGAKIAANTIAVGNMGPGSVDNTVIQDGAITTKKILAKEIKADNIDTGAITADKIEAGAITIGGTTGHIPDGAIAGSGEVVPKISSGGQSKVFRDLANYNLIGQVLPGAFLVRTPITFGNYMTQISIKGYQYQSGNSDIDVKASVYAYGPASGPVLHSIGYNSMGAMSVQVTFCITDDEVPKLALLLKANNSDGIWKYPQFNIAEAIIRSAPDSFGTGWSIEYVEDVDNDPVVSGWTKSTPSGNSGLDQAENTRITDGWIATGTTEINGGKIKTDTIEAGAIKTGSITIGAPNSPLNSAGIATSGQLTAAEQKAANDLAAAQTALATDATNKANAAQTEAERIAKLYADGEIGDAEVRAADEAARVAEAERVEAVRLAGIATANAVLPINTTLDNWGADGGRTYINGGNIKTGTIDAASIKAGSIVVGAANSPISSTNIVTPAILGTTRTEILGTADTAAGTKVANALVPINSSIGTINTNVTNVTTTANNTATTLSGLTALQGGVTVIDGGKIKTDSITTLALAANAVIAENILAGEITGTKLAANLAVVNSLKVQSSIEINHANGHIKSSNYTSGGTAGFYMDQQQLIINDGKIKAAAIELQDSSNIMPPLYASFNANASAYTVAKLWSGSLSGTTKVANDGKFGGGSVQFVITSNTGFVGMGTSGTDLNIPIEGGNQYIISFYVSNRSSKAITLQPQLYQTSAITVKGASTSIANSTAWVRHSVVVTAPATMTRAILRFNLTAGATATFKLDGIQVEQKTGAIDTPSNWSPPGYTSIDGESITTGEISSNQTVNTGNGAIAKWSINTQGEARFGDVTVDGQLIVGKSSYSAAQNANTSVKSDNYVTGTEGWAIKGNGDVEFNNGTFRGMLSLEKADLSMKASVSPIKVFSSPIQSTTIDAAHIRGVTYSYNRELKAGTEDTHYPTTPRLDRKGNFFIGPTTDRSVNIQVHDDTAEDAVYLGDPPVNVSITALNIGEQTNPASPPAVREDQGLSFRAQRTEERNYSYTGGDTEQENVSRILSGVSSTVKLRSPLYPESDDGLDMYPESSNVLQSVTDYAVPKNKNLLPSGEAVGWTFNPLMRDSIQGAAIQPEFGSSMNAGDGRMASIAVTPFSSSKYVRIAPFSPISYTSGKRHIASFYVNSEEASSDIYFGVKSGGMFLSPTEPANASLPAATDIYSTNPPGDYWPLTSNWLNTGASKGMSNIDHFSGGTPSFVNGAVNLAAGQRIRASGTKANHFTGGGTVSFWFKPATTGNTGECNMYHRGVSSSVNKEMWVILNGSTNRLQGGIALTGTARHWESTTTITSGEWHHIAIVIGPSTTNRVFQVYINGVQEVNTTFTSITGGFDTGQYLHLGADRDLTQQFTGQIGDVAHWEVAANPQDIANIHASPRSAWPSDSFTGSQVAVVPPGQKAHRVSFWSDSLSSSSSPAITAIQSGIPSKFNLFAFQLEEAAYKDDMSLSAALRDSKRPTAWSVSNLEVKSSAKISVETKPVVNFLDYVESTKAVLPNQRSGLNIEPPAQITFDVGSRFSDDYAVTEGVFSGDMFTADASYKMSSKGFSYPGSPQPFMPTALDLHYDFTGLALTSRPRLGGSGYLFLGLNNQDLGGVRYGGEGVVIKDNFDYPNQDPMPSPWQVVGSRTARIVGKRAHLPYNTTTVDGEKYVYHGHEFQSHNQTASCTVEGTQGIGWRYGYGGPMISINPIKGDRIHLVVLNGSSPTWRLVVFKNNVKTTLRSGSFAGTRTGIPVIKLSRTGNKITGWYNNTQLFTQTYTDTQLPQGGRFAGFAANVGYMDNYIASRSGADAAANGEIQPYSFNVNNGRGLKVVTDYEVIDTIPYRVGEIHVLAPGYYTMSVTVRAESLGNAQADDFWMDAVDYRDIMGRENRTIQLSNQANQSNGSGAGAYLTGNATAYIEGRLEFRMFTDDTSVNRINRIEITVVRVA